MPERPIYIASANPLVTPNAPLSYAMNMVGNFSIQRPISQCYGLVAVGWAATDSALVHRSIVGILQR